MTGDELTIDKLYFGYTKKNPNFVLLSKNISIYLHSQTK
jgi:hypothetical protein